MTRTGTSTWSSPRSSPSSSTPSAWSSSKNTSVRAPLLPLPPLPYLLSRTDPLNVNLFRDRRSQLRDVRPLRVESGRDRGGERAAAVHHQARPEQDRACCFEQAAIVRLGQETCSVIYASNSFVWRVLSWGNILPWTTTCLKA